MKAMLGDEKSIYLQIAESIEDDVLTGLIREEELIPSTNQFARHYSINPATAAKGVNLLVDDGIIYKKRGIGMCVQTGARQLIQKKRKQEFYENYVTRLLKEADKLGILKKDLITMIERGDVREQ